jgi:hypothetical protein
MLIIQILLFTVPFSAVFNLVSKCRSAVRVIQKHSRFKFALIIMLPVALLLSAWIHRTIPVPKDFGYYKATSANSTIQGYAEALGMERVFQTLLFVLFSVVLFLVFRLALSNLLSCFAVVMFMTNAQVVLVYLSAPFWDFSTAVIPLVAIIGTIVLLSSQHQNFSLTRETRRKFVVTIICLNLVIVSLYLRVYNLMAQQRISIFASASVVLIVGLIWVRSERNEAKSENRTVLSTSGSDRLFFVPILFTLFLLQPVLGRGGKSWVTMILIICLFFFVCLENRLRTIFKFVILALFLLMAQLRSSGDYFQFYSFAGWTGAPILLNGTGGGSYHSLGIPFTDGAIWQIAEINAGNLFFQNAFINARIVVANIKNGWTYVTNGFWIFSEPPLGVDFNAWDPGRKFLLSFASLVSPVLFISAAIFCFQKSRRIAIFIASILTLFLVSIGSTRAQMHQWWLFQTFGLYGALYIVSRLGNVFTSIFFDQISSIRFKNQTNLFEQISFKVKSKLSRKSFVKFLSFLLVIALGPKTVFGILEFTAEKLETKNLAQLATKYNSQNWKLISLISDDSENVQIQSGSNLVKLEVSQNCDLTGIRVSYRNSDALGLGLGEYYRTKFHIANTSSEVAYVPLFPLNIGSPTISISILGVRDECFLRAYQTIIKEKFLPLVALLVPNEENSEKQYSAKESITQFISKEILLSPLIFEGHVENNGYQAVGDETSHDWLNYQIGDRILGRSKQGYQVVDLWMRKIDVETDGLIVIVRGEISRGVLAIGWAESNPLARSAIPIDFKYVVRGSMFDNSKRKLYECFELPEVEEVRNGSKIDLFVGSVFDLYSPRWTSFKISSISLEQGACEANLQPINFLPTL